MRGLPAICLAIAFLAACGDSRSGADGAGTENATVSPATTAQVAGVARAIEASPAAADSILSANGLTRDGFDELLYRIAMDPEQSRAYVAALESN